MKTKYIFLMSEEKNVGKTLIASSLASIYLESGINVSVQKVFLNVTSLHNTGELFLIQNGDQLDYDIGYYERFLNCDFNQNNITSLDKINQFDGLCNLVICEIADEINEDNCNAILDELEKYDGIKIGIVESDCNLLSSLVNIIISRKENKYQYLPKTNNIYDLPLLINSLNIDHLILDELEMDQKLDVSKWVVINNRISFVSKKINIGIVGKYSHIPNSYLSIDESIFAAGLENGVDIEIDHIKSQEITCDNVKEMLKKYNGLVIAGGFGIDGIDGKLEAIKYARESNKPLFGICLGMQLIAIEYARNVLNLIDANSSEMNNNFDSINIVDEVDNGKSRKGLFESQIDDTSKVYSFYHKNNIFERHIHSFAISTKYKNVLFSKSLKEVSISTKDNIGEIIELQDHKFHIGCQFHPEFVSRPDKAHPLFVGFIKNCI